MLKHWIEGRREFWDFRSQAHALDHAAMVGGIAYWSNGRNWRVVKVNAHD